MSRKTKPASTIRRRLEAIIERESEARDQAAFARASLGQAMREIREEKNLRMVDVAKAAHVTISDLSRIERGLAREVRPITVQRIVDALDALPRQPRRVRRAFGSGAQAMSA